MYGTWRLHSICGAASACNNPNLSSLSSFTTMAEDEKTPSVGTPVWTTDGSVCVCQVTGRGPLLHKTIILMDIDSVHNHINTHIFYDLYLYIYIWYICIYIYLCVYIYIWYVYIIIIVYAYVIIYDINIYIDNPRNSFWRTIANHLAGALSH